MEAAEQETANRRKELELLRQKAKESSERAFKAGKAALEADPNNARSNRAMADYYRFGKSEEQMRPLLDRTKDLAPGSARLSYTLGAHASDDPTAFERAFRYFDEALEANPKYQRARFKLAQLHLKNKSVDKALLHAKTILEQVPEHEGAQALVAQLSPSPAPPPPKKPAPEEKKPVSAPKPPTFDRLLEQAQRMRLADRPRRAARVFEKALALEADDPDALAGLGWCYIDLEDPNAAITKFKRIVDRLPRYSDAHMGLAEAYNLKGMKRDAIKHYQKYLQVLPDGPDAPVARRMLKQLR